MDYRKLAVYELESVAQLKNALSIAGSELTETNGRIKELNERFRATGADAGDASALRLYKNELLSRKKSIKLRLERINSALRVLTEEERELLYRSYIERQQPVELMERENLEKSAVYRRRSEALERFTRAMYGVVLT